MVRRAPLLWRKSKRLWEPRKWPCSRTLGLRKVVRAWMCQGERVSIGKKARESRPKKLSTSSSALPSNLHAPISQTNRFSVNLTFILYTWILFAIHIQDWINFNYYYAGNIEQEQKWFSVVDSWFKFSDEIKVVKLLFCQVV